MGRMVSLGRVAAPKPINLPSQRLENNGQDPNVHLVPTGTHTWNQGSGETGSAHPAVARSALVAHPGGGDAPAWSSGVTWGGAHGAQPHDPAPYRRDPRPTTRADSFPNLHDAAPRAASAAEHSDRSLGFVDEAPGSGSGSEGRLGVASGQAPRGGYAQGLGQGHYGAGAGHAAYPGERLYGDGRDRGGWGDRPPPVEGWSHTQGSGGDQQGGYDGYGCGGYAVPGGGYDQRERGHHNAKATRAEYENATRDPRTQHRGGQGTGYEGRGQGQGYVYQAVPPLPPGPPPLPPGPPPAWAKQNAVGVSGNGESQGGALAPAATEPPPPPPAAPPPGPPPTETAVRSPVAVRVLQRPSATPASPNEFSSANLPEHLRDLRLNATAAAKKLWTPDGEAGAGLGGRGGTGGRGGGKKKSAPKVKTKPGDASGGELAAGDETPAGAKGKDGKKKQPKKEQQPPPKKNAKAAAETEGSVETTTNETGAAESTEGKKNRPSNKKKQGGAKKSGGDAAAAVATNASASAGETTSTATEGAGAGAGAPGTPKQPKKGTPKSGGGGYKQKPKTKEPAKNGAAGGAEPA